MAVTLVGVDGGPFVTVRLLDAETPSYDAVIVVGVFEVTAFDVMVKLAVVLPAGTSTVEGTVAAAALLDDIVTAIPFAGAWAFSVMVPVALAEPPITELGLIDSELSHGLIVSDAVFCVPLYVAVIVAVWVDVTCCEVTGKLADDVPAPIVAVEGTVAADGLLLVSETVIDEDVD